MRPVGFLLDENVDPAIRRTVQARQPEAVIWVIGDPGAPARGTLDPEILAWCAAEGVALVTYNRASMPVHLAEYLLGGGHISGIFVLDSAMTFGQIVESLLPSMEPRMRRNMSIR